MVRAILAGAKTQTRRVVKPEHLRGSQLVTDVLDMLGPQLRAEAARYCPYGQPGDRLWVRETFTAYKVDAHEKVTTYRADDHGQGHDDLPPGVKWKPSIHMPRKASRIALEIVSVRAERLKSISEQDAISEGVDASMPFLWSMDEWQNRTPNIARYAGLWELINGGGSWDSNPWVWVIKFKRV